MTIQQRSTYRAFIHRLALALALLMPLGLRAQPEVDKEIPLRIGFTKSIFQNRNENDVLAAMKVWAQTISKERNLPIHPNMVILSVEEAIEQIQNEGIDALTINSLEIADLPTGLVSGPYFRDQVNGSTHKEYILIGKNGSFSDDLSSLEGKTLSIYDNQNAAVGELWLAAELAKAGLPPMKQLFSSTQKNTKLSGAVLSIFFGNADVCLATKDGFDSMVELNPQVGKQLEVFQRSPEVLPSAFCFRTTLPENRKQRLLTEVLRLHETVTGKQVLHVFKSSGILAVSEEALARTIEQVKHWQETVASRGSEE